MKNVRFAPAHRPVTSEEQLKRDKAALSVLLPKVPDTIHTPRADDSACTRNFCLGVDGVREIMCPLRLSVIAASACAAKQATEGCFCPHAPGALKGYDEVLSIPVFRVDDPERRVQPIGKERLGEPAEPKKRNFGHAKAGGEQASLAELEAQRQAERGLLRHLVANAQEIIASGDLYRGPAVHAQGSPRRREQ